MTFRGQTDRLCLSSFPMAKKIWQQRQIESYGKIRTGKTLAEVIDVLDVWKFKNAGFNFATYKTSNRKKPRTANT